MGRLGASWEPLGASWASLGRLLAPLKAMSEKLLVFPAYARARARNHRRITCLGCERKAALEVNQHILCRLSRCIFDLSLFLLTLGSLLGASWGLLGTSWEPLGASWASLGRLLAPLGALLGRSFFEIEFWSIF